MDSQLAVGRKAPRPYAHCFDGKAPICLPAPTGRYEAEQTTKDVVHLDDVELWVSGMLTELRRLNLRVPKEMAAGYPKEFRIDLEQDLEDRLTLVLRSLHGFAMRVTEIRG